MRTSEPEDITHLYRYWVKAREFYDAAEDWVDHTPHRRNAAASRYYYAVVLGSIAYLTEQRWPPPPPRDPGKAQGWCHRTVPAELREMGLTEWVTAMKTLRGFRVKADYEPEAVRDDEITTARQRAAKVLNDISTRMDHSLEGREGRGAFYV